MAGSALHVIQEQLGGAIRAPKCYRCGCLHKTVEALASTEEGQGELAGILNQAKSVFVPQEYDCLGCPVCYPAIATNAFAEMHPDAAARLDLCPTEEPDERKGWPPLPGDYHVLRYQAPVAVCTLNSPELAAELRSLSPAGLSIVGTMRTENLGIERLIRNTNANPNIRFLILCGQDTQQQIGHLPGQSLSALFANGLAERLRIIGARGKRPVLKNVTAEEVASFRQTVELIDLSGEEQSSHVADQIERCTGRNPGTTLKVMPKNPVVPVFVGEPEPLMLDPAGYFIVYPEPRRDALVLEHYTNQGALNAVLEGRTAAALYQAAITRRIVSRLDHAAYLGRELARAERSLKDGTVYVQDRAPEPEQLPAATGSSCGCSGGSCQ
jgi:tetrahydromethanopterin S-methyltransferase subunit A